nr:hypothetical protein [Tanacetum cinerariifolium]
MREFVEKYKADKVCYKEIIKMPLVDFKVLEVRGETNYVNARSRRSTKVDESKLCDIPVVCEFPEVFSKDLIGGARVVFEDEFGAAEEREVSCEDQQGRSRVKRKLFRSCRNNMGDVRTLIMEEAYATKYSVHPGVMILSGADNRLPMLEKDMYESWKIKMELYMMNRQHGHMILESVEKGPLIWPTVEENGVTRPKKYSELTPSEVIQADCDVKATVVESFLLLLLLEDVSKHYSGLDLGGCIQTLLWSESFLLLLLLEDVSKHYSGLDLGGCIQTLLWSESFLLLLPYKSQRFQGYFTFFFNFKSYIVEHLIQSEP